MQHLFEKIADAYDGEVEALEMSRGFCLLTFRVDGEEVARCELFAVELMTKSDEPVSLVRVRTGDISLLVSPVVGVIIDICRTYGNVPLLTEVRQSMRVLSYPTSATYRRAQ